MAKDKNGKKIATNPLSGKNALQIIGYILILTGAVSSGLDLITCIVLILIGTVFEILGNKKAKKKQEMEETAANTESNTYIDPDNQ